MKQIREATKKKLRMVKAELRAAICSCSETHDPYWMKCPRAYAEWKLDDVMAQIRYELSV